MFITAVFTTAKTWKRPKCPRTEEWIKKTWYIHTVEYYPAIKKGEIMSSVAIRMELGIVTMKQDREGKILHDIPYMWNRKRDDANELTYETETHRLRKWTCRGGGKDVGKRRGVWAGRVHGAVLKMDDQQPGWEGALGDDMCGWVPLLSTWSFKQKKKFNIKN